MQHFQNTNTTSDVRDDFTLFVSTNKSNEDFSHSSNEADEGLLSENDDTAVPLIVKKNKMLFLV